MGQKKEDAYVGKFSDLDRLRCGAVTYERPTNPDAGVVSIKNHAFKQTNKSLEWANRIDSLN